MAIAMRVRAGNGEIKVLMTHPSENGLRKDAKTGQMVPAHFIKNVTSQSTARRFSMDNGVAAFPRIPTSPSRSRA
jgi:hypothetical protein